MRFLKRPIPLFVAAMVISGLLTAGHLAGAEPADHVTPEILATVTFIRGTPVLAGDASRPGPLTEGQALYAGSTVQTDASARVELALSGGGVVRLAEGSILELGTSDPQQPLMLLKGSMWANFSNQRPEASPRVLVLGALVVGPKSVFRTALYGEGGLEVKVYTGQVTASGPFLFKKENNRYSLETHQGDEEGTMDPWQYQIMPYQKMMVLDSGAASQPFRFAAKSDLTDWVRWNQQRDGK